MLAGIFTLIGFLSKLMGLAKVAEWFYERADRRQQTAQDQRTGAELQRAADEEQAMAVGKQRRDVEDESNRDSDAELRRRLLHDAAPEPDSATRKP